MEYIDKKNIEGWLDDAELLLKQAQESSVNRRYHYVVFNMQQAEEKIAKSTLACIHMVKIQGKQPPILELVNSMIGLSNKRPKDYHHDWHVELLNTLSSIYNSPVFKIVLSPDMHKQIYERIKAAQKVESKPNVTSDELDGLIKGCNMLLDIASNTDNIFNNFNSLQGGLTVDVGALIDNITNITNMDKNSSKNFIMQRIAISINLITLAILDVILSPHSDARFYPDTKAMVVLDENFPLVAKYADLCQLLKRTIDMDRKYIGEA
ncbi:MAG: HEPN domain-containing protein [Nitrososphaeria archaeon]